MVKKHILIMAGGTGGHVFPALAVAEELQQNPAIAISWLGTTEGLEAQVIPAAGIPLYTLPIRGWRGKHWWQKLLLPAQLIYAIAKASLLLSQLNPSLVIGFGGYASGPGGIAAKLLGIPLVIHEQNAIAGMTNRYLAKCATRVLQAFPQAFPNNQALTTGNPIRKNLLALSVMQQASDTLLQRPLHLLILGGSLGAQAINTLLPAALATLATENLPNIWHQTGAQHWQTTQARYQAAFPMPLAESQLKIVPFIQDMAAAYAWADLVIARAGALTIAELAAVGKASILIPLPSAVDDHQTHNALYLSEAKAAILLPQSQLTVETLSQLLTQLITTRQNLITMAECAKKLGKPHATTTVVQACLELLK